MANFPFLRITVDELRRELAIILNRYDVPSEVTISAIGDLIQSEVDGYHSHGLIRIFDYISDIESGRTSIDAVPTLKKLSEYVTEINGNRAFGVLCKKAIAQALTESRSPVCFATLKNASHLGRLSSIGFEVSGQGKIVCGGVTFRGKGERVAPPGSSKALLCTNPILISVPRAGASPLVVDMSTSTVSEGNIRAHLALGESLAGKRWLKGLDGNECADPAALYETPPTASIFPLGGIESSHKGFSLGMMVEILCAIAPGSEFMKGDNSGPGGNCGMFCAFRPSLFGSDTQQFYSSLETFLSAISSNVATNRLQSDARKFRLPGVQKSVSSDQVLEVNKHVWERIRETARG